MQALWISSGMVVWALHFTLIYGFTALACARGFGTAAPWVVGAATLVAAALAVALVLTNLYREFTRWMTAAVAAAALLAILWEGLPAVMVQACA